MDRSKWTGQLYYDETCLLDDALSALFKELPEFWAEEAVERWLAKDFEVYIGEPLAYFSDCYDPEITWGWYIIGPAVRRNKYERIAVPGYEAGVMGQTGQGAVAAFGMGENVPFPVGLAFWLEDCPEFWERHKNAVIESEEEQNEK